MLLAWSIVSTGTFLELPRGNWTIKKMGFDKPKFILNLGDPND